MNAKEAERPFLQKVSEYLISLPFDLKILQEAVTDPDLDRAAREEAAGAIVYCLLPQEGDVGPLRFVDDLLVLRVALHRVSTLGGDGAQAFRDRFSDAYACLDDDLKLFAGTLGDLWPWLEAKLPTLPKLMYKGKKPAQYVDDEEAAAFLYDEGLEFQTNYNVSEEQVRNKLRRVDQVLEVLKKRRTEESKMKG